jgi:hypothetical protein
MSFATFPGRAVVSLFRNVRLLNLEGCMGPEGDYLQTPLHQVESQWSVETAVFLSASEGSAVLPRMTYLQSF